MTGLDLYRLQLCGPAGGRRRPPAPRTEVGGVANQAAAIVAAARLKIDKDLPRSNSYPTAVVGAMQTACVDAVGALSRVVASLKAQTSRELDDKAQAAFAQWSQMVSDAQDAMPAMEYVAILLAARQTSNPNIKFPDSNYKLQVLNCLSLVEATLDSLNQSELKIELNEAEIAPFRTVAQGITDAVDLAKRAAGALAGAGKHTAAAVGSAVWAALKGPFFWLALALLAGALLLKYL